MTTFGSSRALFAGGVKMFSNDFADTEVSGRRSCNRQFVESATHYIASDATHTQEDQYTINDQLVFDLELSKYNPSSGKYEHYSAIEDMQLEFTMLDPHIRTDLKPAKGTPGKYSLLFRAPDRHGVYKFVVNHNRKGFSSVEASLQVAIVPPRHD
ncbi:oligosaccharyl transferase glycoprotein complex, beta subunit, partial [Tulasnella sp. 419]